MSNIPISKISWERTSEATIKRITDVGIITVGQLLTYTPEELAEKITSQVSTVDKILSQAMKEYGGFKKGDEVAEEQSKRFRISTGSSNLDRLLLGGIESEVITELISEFKGGKSQQCFTSAVIATNQEPDPEKGAPHVIFIDCENTWQSTRITEIASARGFNAEETLSRFIVAKPLNSYHQQLLINALDVVLTENHVNLVVVDGMLSHLRSEYLGREMMGKRQGSLGVMLNKLLGIASSHKIPVMITNQVQGNVTGYGGYGAVGSSFNPAGGHVMAHACTHRVLYKKASKNSRIVNVIDSPNISDAESVRIAITAAGITDEGKPDGS
jgi:DNA repair protein RadA